LDEARIYELTDAKAKKFSFEIVTPRKNYTVAGKGGSMASTLFLIAIHLRS